MHYFVRQAFAVKPITSFFLVIQLLGSGVALAQSGPLSIEEKIQDTGQGVGRFRGGVYGSLGWGHGTRISTPNGGSTGPSGLHVEAGVYGLFNPIRDFADIETGLSLTGMTSSSTQSNNGAVSNKTGYIAGQIYAGPVFRLGQSGSALAVGMQALVGTKIVKNGEDTFVKQYPPKMKPKPGLYVEYQYQRGLDNAIYFSRLTVTKYEVTFQGAPASVNDQGKGNTLLTLQFGIKN
ncbi:MAG: hypothetical protein IPG93_19215 [Burkholderiales bacterium]|nr:hypothetical protein [Burkholderiales bacterium]